MHSALDERLIELVPSPVVTDETWKDIATVHDEAYVRAVREGHPRALAESQGFVWSGAFAHAVARIWAGHAAACELALGEGLVLHPVSGAHHASRGRGGGYCTFNFLVGAARRLLDRGTVRRVLIVDLDAHQGDGTCELVEGDERFAVFDIAGAAWIGERRAPGRRYGVARDRHTYARLLTELPAMVDAVRPDLIEYQAGMDCHEHDHVGGIDGVDAEFLAARDRLVIGEAVRRGIPTVINLAGGYQRDGTTVRLHVETIRIAARLTNGQSCPPSFTDIG